MKVCSQCGACFEDTYDACSFDRSPLDLAFEGKRVLGERYLLEQRVAEGAMGVVFRATHLQVGSTVAVKLMRPQRDGLRIGMQRFWREAQILGQIKHPNAVLVMDFGVEERAPAPFPYLVTEFLRGQALSSVLEEAGGRMSLEQAAAIVGPLCEAVEEAHEAGVIHRDIKPSNIFLERLRDDTEVVKVLDFGIAKFVELDEELLERKRQERAAWALTYAPDERDLLDEVAEVRGNETPTVPQRLRSLASTEAEAVSEGTITEAGFMIGTIPYMAPEQMTGERVSRRTDVYAVATVLFRLLAGRLPYDGADDEIIAGKVSGDVPSLREVGVDVPAQLDAILVDALALEPAERPAQVSQIASALDDAVRQSTQRAPSAPELVATIRALDDSFVALAESIESFAATSGDADAYASARDRLLSLLSPLSAAAQNAERLPTRIDDEERGPLARVSDELSLSTARAGTALRPLSQLDDEAKERADYLRALFARLLSSVSRLCSALDARAGEVVPSPAPAASVFDDVTGADVDLESFAARLRSADELTAADAFEELMSLHAGALVARLRASVDESTDALVHGLWRFADVLLLRELYPARAAASVRVLPALRRYEGEAAAPFRQLAALFSLSTDAGGFAEATLDRALGTVDSEVDRRTFLRALLVHPDLDARRIAIARLRPADVWPVVAHAHTPVDVLRALFDHFAADVGDEYLKVFFLCCFERLLDVNAAGLAEAFRLLGTFLAIECFLEDVVFDRLLEVDRALRERAASEAVHIPDEAAYVARAADFARVGAVESHMPENFRDVPLPIQRMLAREGLFLGYFVSHVNERIAKETLPHLFRKEDVTRFLRVPTIHRAVLVGLSKKRRLLRKEAPRIALLHNPRTPAHAARAFVPLLSLEQLRQLGADKAANPEVRTLAKAFLNRVKLRREQ